MMLILPQFQNKNDVFGSARKRTSGLSGQNVIFFSLQAACCIGLKSNVLQDFKSNVLRL